jgi:hypothetical protein
MKMFTKRNAAIGWATLVIAKRMAKRKARKAGGTRKRKTAVAAVAATTGAVVFWRRRRGRADELPAYGEMPAAWDGSSGEPSVATAPGAGGESAAGGKAADRTTSD